MSKVNRGLSPMSPFEISAGVNSGTDLDRMDSFLRKLGFQLTGGNYSLLMNPGTQSTQ